MERDEGKGSMNFSKSLLIGLFVTMFGCANPFAPELGEVETGTNAVLTERQNPEEVLENFRFAYIFGDSLVYSELIDTGFVFIYFDPSVEGTGRFDSWGRDTELKTTAGLFRAVRNISLEWNSTIEETYWSPLPDSVLSIVYFEGARKAKLSKSFVLKLDTEIQLTGTAVFFFDKEVFGEGWRIERWVDESIF